MEEIELYRQAEEQRTRRREEIRRKRRKGKADHESNGL